MKKAFFIFALTAFILVTLCGCSPVGYMNILLFTDRFADISGTEITLEAYSVTEDGFRLIISDGTAGILLTACEDEEGRLKSAALTLTKTDSEGNIILPDEKALSEYKERVAEMLYAFTLFDEDRSREITEKILPLKAGDLLRTGELTSDAENYRFVYYSNKLCCRFTVTDSYLEKTETTEKPVSRPLLEY